MGNLLTIEALRQADLEGSFDNGHAKKLRFVVLASPDVDVHLFTTQIRNLPVKTHKFFTLISRDDKALSLIEFLSGGKTRVGNANVKELENLGVTIIDLSDVKSSESTHSKFAASPEIVQALGRALDQGGSVDTRHKPPVGVKIFNGVLGGIGQIISLPSQIVN